MASLNKQYYIIVNSVSGDIEPGATVSDVPKLYTLAGAKRSVTHKNKWAAEQARKRGETIVRDNWHIVPVTIEIKEDENGK